MGNCGVMGPLLITGCLAHLVYMSYQANAKKLVPQEAKKNGERDIQTSSRDQPRYVRWLRRVAGSGGTSAWRCILKPSKPKECLWLNTRITRLPNTKREEVWLDPQKHTTKHTEPQEVFGRLGACHTIIAEVRSPQNVFFYIEKYKYQCSFRSNESNE